MATLTGLLDAPGPRILTESSAALTGSGGVYPGPGVIPSLALYPGGSPATGRLDAPRPALGVV